MKRTPDQKTLVKQVRFRNQRFTIFLRPDADESVVAEIFEWQDYRAAEPLLCASRDPILDVGAHIGVFTLFARALNGAARIYALEPEEENFAFLRRNLAANQLREVKVFQAALGGKTGAGRLLLESDSINHHLARDAGEAAGSASQKVSVFRLGDFLRQNQLPTVGLVKMDIEGGEYAVLENMSEEDFARVQNFFLEYHDLSGHRHRELDELLRRQGFGVQIFPSAFEKGMGFLLARNKRRKSASVPGRAA